MSDLVAFIRARLDEDEALARDAIDEAQTPVAREMRYPFPERLARCMHDGRHSPARVLREVEAMRAILGQSFSADENERAYISEHGNLEDYEYPLDGELIRRHLAAIWRDHPDYDRVKGE